VVEHARDRLERLAREERFEEAVVLRDRTIDLVRATDRWQRMSALAALPELVAGQRRDDGGWDLAVVRHGRLAGSALLPRGAPARPAIDALVATAETVLPDHGPLPASSAEEVGLLLRWLDTPGTRLVEVTGTWTAPARAAASQTDWLTHQHAHRVER